MNFNRFIPITKSDDEQHMVYGWASTPELDSQGEIITVDAMKKALPKYMNFPTIREMHQPSAVGTTKEATIESNKGMYIGAKIVDKNAWEKVKEGVYRAFSIGGHIVSKIDNVIDQIELTEISLVDVPANSNAKIMLYKADDAVKTYARPDKKQLPIYTPELIKQSMVEYLNGKRENAVQNRIIKACIEFDIDTKGFIELCNLSKYELNQRKMLSNMTPFSKSVKSIINLLKEENMEKKQKKEEVVETPVVEEVKEVKEEVNEVVEETKEKVEETPEVVVDEAKQTSDVPEFMKRLEALETKITKTETPKIDVDLQKFESVEKGLSKMASLLEKFDDRLTALEAQPKPTKTKVALVEKTFEKVDEKPVNAELNKINSRIQEIVSIKESNPGLYASDAKLQAEAQDLLDKRYNLLKD